MKSILHLLSSILFLAAANAGPVYFDVTEMTGNATDVTLNVRAVNNPVLYNSRFYYLPVNGTNLTTSGGTVTNNFIPGAYTVTIAGLPKAWKMYVTNNSTAVSAVALSREIVVYSGLQSITGNGIQVTNDGVGNISIVDTNGGGGSGGTGGVSVASSASIGTVTNGGVVTPFVQGTLTNNITGTAATATLATSSTYVGNTLTNRFNLATSTNSIFEWWNITAWGDSMTAGTYPTNLSIISGRPAYNGGVISETSAQILTRVLADPAKKPWTAIFWAGRNDLTADIDSTNALLANIGRMITNTTSGRWFVMSVFNKTNETAGTTAHAKLTNFNGMLSALFTNRYLDGRSFIVLQTNGGAFENTENSLDVIPQTMRFDDTHLTPVGYARLAHFINSRMGLIETNFTESPVTGVDLLKSGRYPPAFETPVFMLNRGGSNITMQVVNTNGDTLFEIRNNGNPVLGANTFVGKSAGAVNASGAANTGVGLQALTSSTTSIGNTAVGQNSARFTTVGGLNVSVGNNSLYSNVSGNNNVAVGDSALLANTASGNTAVGKSAAVATTSGANNSAGGFESMLANTVGQQNAAWGYAALHRNVGGGFNSAFGAISLQNNTNQSFNSALGYTALRYNEGAGNSALGYAAGVGAVSGEESTNDAYNVFIGYEASRSLSVAGTQLTNSIAVGKGAKITASNQMMIGGGGATGAVNVLTYGTVTASSFIGSGAALTVDASGFNGNLTTSDNTLQEVAQKLDDLTASSGSYTNNTGLPGVVVGAGIGTNLATLATLAGNNVFTGSSNRFTGDIGLTGSMWMGGLNISGNLSAGNLYGLMGSGNVTNAAGSRVAYVSDHLGAFAATTSAQLAGVLSDETGSGAAVFATSPSFASGITLSSGAIAILPDGSASWTIGRSGNNLFIGESVGSALFGFSTAGTLSATTFSGSGASLTAIPSTSIVGSTGVLAPSSNQTNYTVPLITGSGNDTLLIYSANTNLFITFTGTNTAFANRSIVINSLTNTVASFIRFASATQTNFNFVNVSSNGQFKILNFFNPDTRGTNVLVSDGGYYRGNFTQ